MTSDAIADPPGLSTRRTIALMVESARALRRYSTIVSDPPTPPPVGPSLLLPAAGGAPAALPPPDDPGGIDDRDARAAVEAEAGRPDLPVFVHLHVARLA